METPEHRHNERSIEHPEVNTEILKQSERRIARQIKGAERLGVNVSVKAIVVPREGEPQLLADNNTDEVVEAASLNKLAVALWLASRDEISLSESVQWDAKDRSLTGGGQFDGDSASTVATRYVLLQDMLLQSGNTSMKMLVGHNGAAQVNAFLSEQGYQHTRLQELKGGWFYSGTTSAQEMLRVMAVLHEMTQKPARDRSACEKLIVESLLATHSQTGTKIREALPGAEVMLKTGELNADEDSPYDKRHSVGSIDTPHGTVLLAILTSAPDKARTKLVAEPLLSHLAVETATTVGLRSRRSFGARVLSVI